MPMKNLILFFCVTIALGAYLQGMKNEVRLASRYLTITMP